MAQLEHSGNVILEQFTGLKDKNGKEIYVGDIYRHKHSSTLYQVMFLSGAFVGGKNESSCSPLGWQVDKKGKDLAPDSADWLVVIGNIHEDAKLLSTEQATEEGQGALVD
jgi:hypothetical protein